LVSSEIPRVDNSAIWLWVRETRRQVSVVSHTARLLESGPLELASWGMKPGLIIEPIPLDGMMLRNIRRAASTSSGIIPDLSDYFEANSVRNRKSASGAQAISHGLNSITATSQKWHNCLYRWCDASAAI
jgi:hypothetical protein